MRLLLVLLLTGMFLLGYSGGWGEGYNAGWKVADDHCSTRIHNVNLSAAP